MLIDNDELQRQTREIAPNVFHSDYKAGPNDSYDLVHAPKFSTVLRKGPVVFTRSFYQVKGVGHYEWASEVYESPTVGDALKAMNDSMIALDDFHHSFYEGVRDTKTDAPPDPYCEHCDRGVKKAARYFEIETGS